MIPQIVLAMEESVIVAAKNHRAASRAKQRKKNSVLAHHFLSVVAHVVADTLGETRVSGEANDKTRRHLHKRNPRSKRRVFNHAAAYIMIQENYLGPTPTFDDKQFLRMLQVSRSRFQRIMEGFMNSEIPFYGPSKYEGTFASVEAKLLLPLKTLAYGVATHTFSDYFQMSPEFAQECCFQFDKGFRKIYTMEYLRRPTAEDLKSIDSLYARVHGVNGMFGSLDCSHTVWKNCPVAWQGSYRGKKRQH